MLAVGLVAGFAGVALAVELGVVGVGGVFERILHALGHVLLQHGQLFGGGLAARGFDGYNLVFDAEVGFEGRFGFRDEGAVSVVAQQQFFLSVLQFCRQVVVVGNLAVRALAGGATRVRALEVELIQVVGGKFFLTLAEGEKWTPADFDPTGIRPQGCFVDQ